jgi:putative heme transporter
VANNQVPLSTTADAEASVVVASAPERTAGKSTGKTATPTVRKIMMRTLKIAVIVFFFFYVLPVQIARNRETVNRLQNVNLWLLLLGLAFELAALLAYSQLTRAALAGAAPKLSTVFRVQLATKAVTNVVPGGSAAGPALGYRLFILAGVDSTAAGFGLAAAGIGSAVVLNLLLFVALLVSIPLSGVNPGYVTAALVAIFVLAAFFTVVIAFLRGADTAERIVASLARHFSFLKPDRIGALIRRVAERITELTKDRALLRRLVFWALMNWLLDAVALWIFLRAFDLSLRPELVLVAFCVANVSVAIPLTPGGIGVFETVVIPFLGAGLAATYGVSSYRLAAYWLPIPLGAATYFSLRAGPWKLSRTDELSRLRDEAGSVLATGESVFDWTDRITEDAANDRIYSAAEAAADKGHVVIMADRAEPGSVRSRDVAPPNSAPRPSAPERKS